MAGSDGSRRNWLGRHRLLEFQNRRREEIKRKQLRKGIRKSKRVRLKYIPVFAPTDLDFDQNYDQTIKFLEQIRRTFAAGGHGILISMGACKSLSPEVALVLAAEVERCRHHRSHSINGNNPKSDAVSAMLRDIGFHKLLHFNEPATTVTPPVKTTYLKMKSGIQGGGQHADALQELVLGDAACTASNFHSELIRGLNEAVLNIHQHAYPDPEEIVPLYPLMPNCRWWIAGYRDSASKEIGFIAFDQGVGIPLTMREKHSQLIADLVSAAGQLLNLTSPTADHLLIQRAFEIGNSQTGKVNQGKGLNDFKKFLAVAGGNGSLRILSGRGSYLYDNSGAELIEPLSAPFHGTLVVWRLTESPSVVWKEGADA